MKKLIVLLLLSFLFACTEKKKTDNIETTAKVEAIKDTVKTPIAVIADTIKTPIDQPETETEADTLIAGSINFKKYAVDMQKSHTKPAPIDWEDYPEAKDFRTRIIEAYKTTEVAFAGHYVLSTFGCGAGCIMGFMVDVRDGKIYVLPLGEKNSCFWSLDRAVCKADSRLFISGICKENEESKNPFYIAYVWNEENKNFVQTDSKEFIVAK